MKKLFFNRKKAVIISVFVITILCLTPSAVAMNFGINTKNIIENKKASFDVKNNDFETLLVTIRNGDKVTYREFFNVLKNQLQNYENPILSFLIQKLENLFKDNYLEKDITNILLKEIDKNKEIVPISDDFLSSDFEYYWECFTTAEDFMKWIDGDITNFDDFTSKLSTIYTTASAIIIIVGIIMFLSFYSTNRILSHFFIEVDILILALFNWAHNYYKNKILVNYHTECQYTSIKMLLNVINPYGDVIDDLQISGFNIDILNVDNPDDYIEMFTYTFKQNDSGEYALYRIVDIDEYRQPPPPPGFWKITIEETENEYLIENPYYTPEIKSTTSHYETIQLEENHPYIFDIYPINELEDVELNPTLYVEVIDYQNNILENVTFYEWYSGNWTEIEKYEDIDDYYGVYSTQPSHFNQYDTTYLWKVNVSDGNYWHEREFSFTTITQ